METIKRGSQNIDRVIMLQELLQRTGYTLAVDGVFGPGTEQAVRDYQRKNGLVVDGIVGQKTWMVLFSQFPDYHEAKAAKFLSEDDLQAVATDVGIELAVIKAVNEVESAGRGFIGGKPKILFERHIFWRRVKEHGLNPQQFVAGNEDILSTKPGGYLGGVREHDRLERAQHIHEAAALESASWGLFQILGYHWKSLGYESIGAFVKLMERSEGDQLQAFARFIKVNNLTGFLKEKDWAGFARGYNGPAYKKNAYDEKMARAYERYARDG